MPGRCGPSCRSSSLVLGRLGRATDSPSSVKGSSAAVARCNFNASTCAVVECSGTDAPSCTSAGGRSHQHVKPVARCPIAARVLRHTTGWLCCSVWCSLFGACSRSSFDKLLKAACTCATAIATPHACERGMLQPEQPTYSCYEVVVRLCPCSTSQLPAHGPVLCVRESDVHSNLLRVEYIDKLARSCHDSCDDAIRASWWRSSAEVCMAS